MKRDNTPFLRQNCIDPTELTEEIEGKFHEVLEKKSQSAPELFKFAKLVNDTPPVEKPVDLVERMAKRENFLAEASGRYLESLLIERFEKYDKKIEHADRKAKLNLFIGFFLGVLGTILANVLTPYASHLLSQWLSK